MDFTKNSKLTLLFDMRFCTRVPGKFFRFTPMPLVYVKLHGKKERDAIWSSAMEGGGSGRNPANRRRRWPGKVWGND
jgi:hypothetical protein